jgi:hypothetical protein
LKQQIDAYMVRMDALGGREITNGGLRARRFTPEQVVAQADEIVRAFDVLGPTEN